MSYGLAGPRNQPEWNKWNLDAFWEEVKSPRQAKNSGYILLILKDYANRVIPRYCFRKKPYWVARKTKTIRQIRGHAHHSTCFCCFKRIYNANLGIDSAIHHILAIKNGGLDLQDNRVVVCNSCHSDIHPWLKDRPDISQGKKKVGLLEAKKKETELDEKFKRTVEGI